MGHHSKLSPCGDYPPGTASPRGRRHLTSTPSAEPQSPRSHNCFQQQWEPSSTVQPKPMFQSRAGAQAKRSMQQALAHAQVWVHEQGDGRLDIVDGKQRITSLLSYLDGIFPRNQQTFALEASPCVSIPKLQAGTEALMAGHTCGRAVMQASGALCVQGLETLVRLNGKAKEDLSEREQSSLADYPLSLRILAQTSGVSLPGHSIPLSSSHHG